MGDPFPLTGGDSARSPLVAPQLPEAVRLEQFIEQEVQSHQWATGSALDRIRRSLLRVAEAAAQQERARLASDIKEWAAYCFTHHGQDARLYNGLADLARAASHPPPTPEDR